MRRHVPCLVTLYTCKIVAFDRPNDNARRRGIARDVDYGADILQKRAHIGAHGFAAHGYDLPRSAAEIAKILPFPAGSQTSQR